MGVSLARAFLVLRLGLVLLILKRLRLRLRAWRFGSRFQGGNGIGTTTGAEGVVRGETGLRGGVFAMDVRKGEGVGRLGEGSGAHRLCDQQRNASPLWLGEVVVGRDGWWLI